MAFLGMNRLFLLMFSVVAFAAPAFFAPGALAQETVNVRTGQHDDYSRLVFDWEEAVTYTVTRQGSKYTLKFDKGAALSDSQARGNPVPNVMGISAVSEAPLEVTVEVPADSRVRDFKAGSRVVIDIYNPPGGPQAPPPPAVAEGKPAKPQPESSKAEKVQHAEEHQKKPSPSDQPETGHAKAEHVPDTKSETRVAVPPAEIESVEMVDEHTLPDQSVLEAAIEKKEAEKPNLITLSATKSMDMAVFNVDDEIWMVTGQPSLFINPQVIGPNSKSLLPIKPTDIAGGKIFKTPGNKYREMRTEGGGLLWRVIVPDAPAPTDHVIPVRENVPDDGGRGGKLVWPFTEVGKILSVPHPPTGKTMIVVTVGNSKQFAGPALDFVDFETLNSAAGLVILPKVDDLLVTRTEAGVEVSRPGGLALTSDSRVAAARNFKQAVATSQNVAQEGAVRRIYDFEAWSMGGMNSLAHNRTVMLTSMAGLAEQDKMETLLTLGKMHLANGLWAESLGFFNFAESQIPELGQNPKFIAMKGAAKALGWETEEAFKELSDPQLDEFMEIGYWRAFALADLGDWQQAEESMPDSFSVFATYPEQVAIRLGLVLAEVALRSGAVDEGAEILDIVDQYEGDFTLQQKAAYQYLRGEEARQNGDLKATKKHWIPLVTGRDELYRAKSGLALTRLLLEEGEINNKQAIDRLERLRYTWRGDDLEAQINYWLGKAYFENSEFIKGLNIMREATSFAAGTNFGRSITSEMADVFSNLFLSSGLENISPMDAAALYEEFSELVPQGRKGDMVVEKLAEHLVRSDLLGRASDLLNHQLDHRLEGLDAYRVAVQLAAIRLLDKHPEQAMAALNRAAQELQKLPEESQTPARFLELSLLRARALSQNNQADQAIALLERLEPSVDVNRLRADIAWNAGYWDDAADALEDVIIDQNISLTRPLEEENSTMILQRAVALNLASDRIGLANMREKYGDAMKATDKAKVFEVITRARQSSALADRETLLGIVSEVDLFENFLEGYKSLDIPSN